MHVCKKKKKKKRDWRDFLLKKTIVIWTLILKTNGIGHNPQYTKCINDCQLDSVFI